jgi:hypothetical protein
MAMKRILLYLTAITALSAAPALAQTQAVPPEPSIANSADSATVGVAPPADTHLPSPADAAKHNAQVDERDKLPIMARVLELNDQQHRLIAQSVGANAPRSDVKLSVEPVVTGLIPQTVPLSDLPANVLNEIPAAIPYKYAIVDNRILLVDPVNSYMVIDIIAR